MRICAGSVSTRWRRGWWRSLLLLLRLLIRWLPMILRRHRTTTSTTSAIATRRRWSRTVGRCRICARREKWRVFLVIFSVGSMRGIEEGSIRLTFGAIVAMSVHCSDGRRRRCRWRRRRMRHIRMRRLMGGRLLHLSHLMIGRRRWWRRRPMMTRWWTRLSAWSWCRSTVALIPREGELPAREFWFFSDRSHVAIYSPIVHSMTILWSLYLICSWDGPDFVRKSQEIRQSTAAAIPSKRFYRHSKTSPCLRSTEESRIWWNGNNTPPRDTHPKRRRRKI